MHACTISYQVGGCNVFFHGPSHSVALQSWFRMWYLAKSTMSFTKGVNPVVLAHSFVLLCLRMWLRLMYICATGRTNSAVMQHSTHKFIPFAPRIVPKQSVRHQRTAYRKIAELNQLHNCRRFTREVSIRGIITLLFTWLVRLMSCDLSLWQWVMAVSLQFGLAVFVERASECAQG